MEPQTLVSLVSTQNLVELLPVPYPMNAGSCEDMFELSLKAQQTCRCEPATWCCPLSYCPRTHVDLPEQLNLQRLCKENVWQHCHISAIPEIARKPYSLTAETYKADRQSILSNSALEVPENQEVTKAVFSKQLGLLRPWERLSHSPVIPRFGW